MSLKLNERYPGRFTNPSADYPFGSFKNRTAPSAKDGSYLEKDWANDKEGFFQSLLSGAGVTANGLVDKVGSSQFYTALLTVAKNAGTSWDKITGKPTTLSGYGITDAVSTTGNAASASKLFTPRTIALTGAATGSGPFDGSSNISISLTLADVPWAKVIGRPTTVAGYGITNALTSGTNNAVPSFFNDAPASGGSASLNLREVGLVAGAQTGPTYAPCLGFLWSSVVYGRMTMLADGQPYWNGSPMLTNSNIDPWAMQPVGALIALLDNNTVPAPPTNNAAYRYVKLTASDAYNSGIMTGESVSGVAPLVIATGVISLAGSPFNTLTVNLINTERRTLRAGLTGVVEQDALQGHYHNIIAGTVAGVGFNAGASTGGNGIINDVVPSGGRIQSPASDGVSGTVRTANETRPKSMGVTYYMRVR